MNSVYKSAVCFYDPDDPDDLFQYWSGGLGGFYDPDDPDGFWIGAEALAMMEALEEGNPYLIALATRLEDPEDARMKDNEDDLSNEQF